MGIISYFVSQLSIDDPLYYPYPHDISAHDNTCLNNGTSPDINVQMGQLFASALSTFPGQHVPDIAWDGVVDPGFGADAGTLVLPDGGTNPDPMKICLQNNGTNDGGAATFVDLNFCALMIKFQGQANCIDGAHYPDGGLPDASFPVPDSGFFGPTNLPYIDSFDVTPFSCTGGPLSAFDAGLWFPDGGI
jgi:hypothetical protein